MLDDSDKAVETTPEDAKALEASGDAHKQQGNYAQAVADYARAINCATAVASIRELSRKHADAKLRYEQGQPASVKARDAGGFSGPNWMWVIDDSDSGEE